MKKEDLIEQIRLIDEAISKLEDPENRSTPIVDGIVDESEYLSAPSRILWILREVNSPDDKEGWGLKSAIRGLNTGKGIKKGWGKTFTSIVKVTNGIFSDRNWEEIGSLRNTPNLIDDLKKIAYVNVKKIPGGSMVDKKKLYNLYQAHKEILLKQIEVFKPDVIICGGTFDLIKDDLSFLNGMEKIHTSPINICQSKERIVVDAYHPCQRTIKQKLYCDSIITAVNEWKTRE